MKYILLFLLLSACTVQRHDGKKSKVLSPYKYYDRKFYAYVDSFRLADNKFNEKHALCQRYIEEKNITEASKIIEELKSLSANQDRYLEYLKYYRDKWIEVNE